VSDFDEDNANCRRLDTDLAALAAQPGKVVIEEKIIRPISRARPFFLRRPSSLQDVHGSRHGGRQCVHPVWAPTAFGPIA
jgi:hypothetical protein